MLSKASRRRLYNFTEDKSQWGGVLQRQDPFRDRSAASVRNANE